MSDKADEKVESDGAIDTQQPGRGAMGQRAKKKAGSRQE